MRFYSVALLLTVVTSFGIAQMPRAYLDSDKSLGSRPVHDSQTSETIDFAEVAKLKIHVVKGKFDTEDIVKVNTATLITAREEIYIPNKLTFDVRVLDSAGQRVKVRSIRFNGLVREMSFQRVKEDYLTHSLTIVIGCRSKAVVEEAKRREVIEEMDTEDPRDWFRIGIFEPIADLCLDAKPGERFSLYVELFNSVLRKDSEMTKTAVGTVRSNTIRFSIRN